MKARLLILVFLIYFGLTACGSVASAAPAPQPVFASTATPSPVSVLAVTQSPFSALLSEIRGTVNIKKIVEPDFKSARDGDVLQVNEQVKTLDDGRVRLDLSSGTIIRVAPSSLFTLESNEPQDESLFTRIKIELGRIFIILSGGAMDIDTPSGLASVRGSYLSISVNPETKDVYVVCLEGTCGASAQGQSVGLVAGQMTILGGSQPGTGTPTPGPLEILPMGTQEYNAWFENAPEATEIIAVVTQTQAAVLTATSEMNTPGSSSSGDATASATLMPTSTTGYTYIYPTSTRTPRPPQPTAVPTSTVTVAFIPTITSTNTITQTLIPSTPTFISTASQTPIPSTSTPTLPATASPTAIPPTNTATSAPPPTASPTINPNTTFSSYTAPNGIITNCANTYTVVATDPNGIANVFLHYSVNDSTMASSKAVVMVFQGADTYSVTETIMGSAANSVVYFNFKAEDLLATTTLAFSSPFQSFTMPMACP